MSTLTYTITATQAEFEGFADRLEYMPMIFDINNQPIPNPETRIQYIQRRMKEAQDKLFYTPYVTEIEQQVRDTMETEKEAMRTNIRNRSTINYVA